MEKIKMVEFLGEMVPAELCTIDREGGADDFDGCGCCFNDPTGAEGGCENCVVKPVIPRICTINRPGAAGRKERRF